MDNVNIYIHTTIKTTVASDGAYGIVLEMPRENAEPYTVTDIGILAKCTAFHAELKCFLYALRKLKKACELTIYMDGSYVQSGIKWVSGWVESGWLTAKGSEVAYKEEWQEVIELLKKHLYKFEIKTPHSYKNWLIQETQQRSK